MRMIFRQENDHSVLRNFWHKGTIRGVTAASPWGAGSFFQTRGTSEEAAKKAEKRRLGDEGKASLRPSREMGGMKREVLRRAVSFRRGACRGEGFDKGESLWERGSGGGPFLQKGLSSGLPSGKTKALPCETEGLLEIKSWRCSTFPRKSAQYHRRWRA